MKQIPFIILAAIAAGTMLNGIGNMELHWDESYYVTAAKQFNDGVWHDPCWSEEDKLHPRPVNYEHPPLAKLIIAGSTATFDDTGAFGGCRSDDNHEYSAWKEAQKEANQTAWRLPGAMIALAGLIAAGAAVWRLAGPLAGTLAIVLLNVDLLYVGQARIALLDPYAAGFLGLAFLGATYASWRGTWATILFLSLAFCSKYTGAFAGPPLLLLHAYQLRKNEQFGRRRFDATLATFALVPIGVLALAYTPFWMQWIPQMGVLASVKHWISLLGASIAFGTGADVPHSSASSPWTWWIVQRPAWYHTIHLGDGTHQWTYAIANPFFLWIGALGAIFGLLGFRRDKTFGFVALLPVLTFLMFLFADRATFIFYAVVLSPGLAATGGILLARMWNSDVIWQRITMMALVAMAIMGYTWYDGLVFNEAMTPQEKEAIFEILPWMQDSNT